MSLLEKTFNYLESKKHLSSDPDTQTACLVESVEGDRVLGINRLVMPYSYRDFSRTKRPAKYKWIIHAEADAIGLAARQGIKLEGGNAYLNGYPCSQCANLLVITGIRKLFCVEPDWDHPRWGDDFKITRQIFRESNLEVEFFATTSNSD